MNPYETGAADEAESITEAGGVGGRAQSKTGLDSFPSNIVNGYLMSAKIGGMGSVCHTESCTPLCMVLANS